jgi:hypothetical protein
MMRDAGVQERQTQGAGESEIQREWRIGQRGSDERGKEKERRREITTSGQDIELCRGEEVADGEPEHERWSVKI